MPRLLERRQLVEELGMSFRDRSALGPFIVEGEPGLGKTALVNASCHRASEEGILVLRARGSPLETSIHLGLVRQLLEGSQLSCEAHVAAGACSWLDGATTEPGLRNGDSMTIAHETSTQPQTLLSTLVAGRPVLVAIDDLHWGDELSLRWLHYVARRLVPGNMWFVASTIPRPRAGLGLVDRMMDEPSARVVSLQPLHLASVRLLVRQCLGDAGTEAIVESCWAATGGNPRLLRALLSAVRTNVLQPETLADEVAAFPLPAVARSVDERLRRLPDEARKVLEALAVLGDQAELAEMAAMAEVSVPVASAAADALADVQLLQRGRPPRFRYRLERSTVLGQLGPARLARAHVRAARLLDELEAPSARVAGHLLRVEPASERWVAARLSQAGQSLLEEGDRELAVRCLARALKEPPDTEQRPPLVAALAATEASMGLPGTLVHVNEAIDLGLNVAGLVDVVIRYAQSVAGDPYPDGTAALLAAIFDRLADAPHDLQLPLQVARASLTRPVAELPRVAAALEQAIVRGRKPAGAWESLAMGHLSFIRACSPNEVKATDVARMAEIAAASPDLGVGDHIWVQSTCRALVALIRAGRFLRADKVLLRAQQAAERDDAELAVAPLSVVRALSLLHQGNLLEAEAACRLALEAATVPSCAPAVTAAGLLAASLLEQGKPSEADAALHGVLPAAAPRTLAEAVCIEQRGRIRLTQGRLAEAIEDLTRARRWAEDSNIVNPFTPGWRIAASAALQQLGRHDDAHLLIEEELEWARSFGAAWSHGAALRAAAAMNEPEMQIDRLTEAIEVLEGSGADLEWARSSVDLGAALSARGSMALARRHLRSGADMACRLGAQPLAERAARELRAAGARPRRLALTGPGSLTPAERRVAELAASGVKNSQIAALLYVSERTVQGHLSRVYRKLGASSRGRLPELLGTDPPQPPATSMASRTKDGGLAHLVEDREVERQGAP